MREGKAKVRGKEEETKEKIRKEKIMVMVNTKKREENIESSKGGKEGNEEGENKR